MADRPPVMIRIVAPAIELPGVRDPHVDRLLASYDPDDVDPDKPYLPRLTTTDDPAEARRFESTREALELWQAVCPSFPTRPDGRPNRPLTGYTIAVETPEGARP